MQFILTSLLIIISCLTSCSIIYDYGGFKKLNKLQMIICMIGFLLCAVTIQFYASWKDYFQLILAVANIVFFGINVVFLMNKTSIRG